MSSLIRSLESLIRSLGRDVLVALTTTSLLLSAAPVGAAETPDQLSEALAHAWQGEAELVDELYAPDAIHTATYYDRTIVHESPAEIAPLAAMGLVEQTGPRIDLPAADGELRWVSFSSLAGGTACLWRAVDGKVTRQDCVLPIGSGGGRPVAAATGTVSPEIDEVMARLHEAWGTGTSVERLATVYAPDAVHQARFLDVTNTYTGPEEIIRVAAYPIHIDALAAPVQFEAPDGELAWASVSDLANGSVCLFRAVDGMITHHDCVLPVAA